MLEVGNVFFGKSEPRKSILKYLSVIVMLALSFHIKNFMTKSYFQTQLQQNVFQDCIAFHQNRVKHQ